MRHALIVFLLLFNFVCSAIDELPGNIENVLMDELGKALEIIRKSNTDQVILTVEGEVIKGHRVSITIGEPGSLLSNDKIQKFRNLLAGFNSQIEAENRLKIPSGDSLAGVGSRSIFSFGFFPEAATSDIIFTTSNGTADIMISVIAFQNEDGIDLSVDTPSLALAIDELYKKR